MGDILTKAITKDGYMRIYSVVSSDTVNAARTYHSLSPVASATLGRLLSGGIMMGAMLKGDDSSLTLQFKGDGPIGSVVVVANSKGNVKGYVTNPLVDLPLK
ncbi:MAG: Hsp33 family molecular chaperone HslO, partial [Oscillospiraceae bacterium]